MSFDHIVIKQNIFLYNENSLQDGGEKLSF